MSRAGACERGRARERGQPRRGAQGLAHLERRWREERARAYKISEGSLEEHYRERSLLKQNVLPEDIAEAILFFAI